jgi:hypothetical protein
MAGPGRGAGQLHPQLAIGEPGPALVCRMQGKRGLADPRRTGNRDHWHAGMIAAWVDGADQVGALGGSAGEVRWSGRQLADRLPRLGRGGRLPLVGRRGPGGRLLPGEKSGDRDVLSQHPHVGCTQRGPGQHAKLVVQPPAHLLVGPQGVRLPVRAREGDHQPRVGPFVERIPGSQRPQMREHPTVSGSGVGVVQHRRRMLSGERRHSRVIVQGTDVGQRLAAPQAERLLECLARVCVCCRAGALDQAAEHQQVEFFRCQHQAVARSVSLRQAFPAVGQP